MLGTELVKRDDHLFPKTVWTIKISRKEYAAISFLEAIFNDGLKTGAGIVYNILWRSWWFIFLRLKTHAQFYRGEFNELILRFKELRILRKVTINMISIIMAHSKLHFMMQSMKELKNISINSIF